MFRSSIMRKTVLAAACLLAGAGLAGLIPASPVSARTFVSVGVGVPAYPAYPAYYGYPGAYAPPVVVGGYWSHPYWGWHGPRYGWRRPYWGRPGWHRRW
jgi:hypothetical protein